MARTVENAGKNAKSPGLAAVVHRCVLLLVDRSASMNRTIEQYGRKIRKCELAAQWANRFIAGLIDEAGRRNVPLDSIHVGIIGYSTDNLGEPLILPLLQPQSSSAEAGSEPLTLAVIQRSAKRDWITPQAAGGSPMCAALVHAAGTLRKWLRDHADGSVRLVLHFTDGFARDGNPLPPARALQELHAPASPALLLNLCLAEASETGANAGDRSRSALYAASVQALLHESSSTLPESLLPLTRTCCPAAFPTARTALSTPHYLFDVLEFALAVTLGPVT